MHRLASAYGVPFSPIPGTPDLAIPGELAGIAAKLQAHAQGAPLALDDVEIRLLFVATCTSPPTGTPCWAVAWATWRRSS